MKFISEEIIERVAEQISTSEESLKKAMQQFDDEQPVLVGYMMSENFDLLTQPEKEYFLFLALVVFHSIRSENELLEEVTEDELGKSEEVNWETLSEVKAKKFRERVDIFFDNYPQEDLLAFVEDALTEEEEEMVTKVGREPMFVALRSMIDCLCEI